MIAIAKQLKRLRSDESGSTSIEYAFIASIMGLMLLPVMKVFSGSFTGWANQIVADFSAVLGL